MYIFNLTMAWIVLSRMEWKVGEGINARFDCREETKKDRFSNSIRPVEVCSAIT